MESPFQSALELFSWSKRNFDILEINIREWGSKAPKARVVDKDPDTGEVLHKYRFFEPFPWQFGALTFDVVNAQRAALDHVMYASAVALNGGQPKGTKFPFGGQTAKDALDDLRRGYNPLKKRGLPYPNHPVVIARALSFKPYERGERDLWALNQIRNMKHHRLLVPSALSAQSIVVQNGLFLGGGMGLTNEWNSSRNELTYLRTTATFSQHDSEITPSVAFDQGTVAGGRLVLEFLAQTGVILQNVIKTVERTTLNIRKARGMDELPSLTDGFP